MSRAHLRIALSISFWVVLTHPVIQVLWIIANTHKVVSSFDIPGILFGVLGYETYRRIALRPAESFQANVRKAALFGLFLSLFCGVIVMLTVVSLAGLLGQSGEFRAYINQQPIRNPYSFPESAALNLLLFPLALWISTKLVPLSEATSFFRRLAEQKKNKALQRKAASRSAWTTRAAQLAQKKAEVAEQRQTVQESRLPEESHIQPSVSIRGSEGVYVSPNRARRNLAELISALFVILGLCAVLGAAPFGKSYASNYWEARFAWMATWFFLVAYASVIGVSFSNMKGRSAAFGACLGAASSTLVLYGPLSVKAFAAILFFGDPRVAGMFFLRVLMLGIAPLIVGVFLLFVGRTAEPLELRTAIAATALLWVPWTAAKSIAKYEKVEVSKAEVAASHESTEMNRVAACLARYYTANKFYPISLRELDSKLPSCLRLGSADERFVEGYRYRYEMGANGQAYALTAEPKHTPGRFSISFFSDETTIIRSHTNDLTLSNDRPDDRLANATDYLDSELLANISGTSRAISDFDNFLHWGSKERWKKAYNPAELSYPEKLAYTKPFNRDTRFIDDNTFEANGYRFTYSLLSDTGRGFELQVRPIEYGRSGVANFMIDVTGVVHTSTEDRNATIEDPPLCGFSNSSCVSRYFQRAPKYELYSPGPFRDSNTHPGGVSDSSHPKLFWAQQMATEAPRIVAASNDRIYATHKSWLIAVGFDGNPIWKAPAPSQTFGLSDKVILQDGAKINQFTADGTLQWSFNGGEGGQAVRSKAGILFVPGPFTYAISPEGKLLWRRRDPELQKDAYLSEDAATLLLRSEERLQAIDTRTGDQLWDAPLESNSTNLNRPWFLPDGSVVVATSRTKSRGEDTWSLVLLDRHGRVLWTRPIAARAGYQVLSGTADIVIFEDRVMSGIDMHQHELWRHKMDAGVRSETWRSVPDAVKLYGGTPKARLGDMYAFALRDSIPGLAQDINIQPPYWVAILNRDLQEVTRFGPISIRYFYGSDCCGVIPTPDHRTIFLTSDRVVFTVRWPQDVPPESMQ